MKSESILISGAGSGMGRLTAQKMAQAGYQVAALDINENGLLETAEGYQNIRTFQVDVCDYEAVSEAVNETEKNLGPIKQAYNAAAIMPLGKIEDQDAEIFSRVMAINYSGVVNMNKAVLPLFQSRNTGDIINFASIAGWLPTIYMAAYDASKFAVVAFTEVLYHENLGNDINIVCVCPPPVKTPLLNQARETVWPKMFDQGDHIETEDVLAAIDVALEKGELFAFPGKRTKSIWRMRRWFPNAIWKSIHKVEGI